MGVEIPFPVIADLDMKVARRYGMIHPGQSSTSTAGRSSSSTMRGSWRAMLYYPISNAVSMPEILQAHEGPPDLRQTRVATPANWQPGEKVIVPAPKTPEEIAEED